MDFTFARKGREGMARFREVMNAREASHYLGVSKETLYKYLREDRLPGFKLGNRWRFKKAVLDRWMERESKQPNIRVRSQSSHRRGSGRG